MTQNLYTFDTETDPFKYGRIPEVFSCCIYNGESCHTEWGKGCMERMRLYIEQLPPGIIYAHYAGRFDFFFMLDWLTGKMNVIGSKIIRAYGLGHEWRDSTAIYPMELAAYKKDEIDYRLMEKNVRNKHKRKIIHYLEKDCIYLYDLVAKFWTEFGNNLTIGSASMKQLKKMHEFESLSAEDDFAIRKRFYYGGRVQYFEQGIITPKGEAIYVYDINQSYPCSMHSYEHPIGKPYFRNGNPTEDTYFLTVSGFSRGCFPCRVNGGGLHYPIGNGIFHVSIHEYKAAIETGQFEPDTVIECADFEETGNFADFVDYAHGMRRQAKLNDDKLGSDFYKFVSNTPYGKFAQSPDNYFDYMILKEHEPSPGEGWERSYWIGDIVVWRKASLKVTRYNVATGASITGASRSMLIRALATCDRPLYCDTDSIICEGMGPDIECDPVKLGAWKLEKYGTKLAIAGRKLYALFDEDGKCVKKACKGVRLTAEEILRVASGEEVDWFKDAPTFSIRKPTKFIKRTVRMT